MKNRCRTQASYLRRCLILASCVLSLLLNSIQTEALGEKLPERMIGYTQVGSWTREGWDYKMFLDMLSDSGMNYTRIFGIVPWHEGVLPWIKGKDGRYDLTKFDEKNWTRLRDYIRYANSKGILVHFTLFDRCGMTDRDGWPSHPFNKDNNVNGINAKRGWHAFTSESFKEVQRNYIIKSARELKDFKILFEIANEPMDGIDWHKWVIGILREEGVKDISINRKPFDGDYNWVSFHIRKLPSSIQGGRVIYSDDGIELRDPDKIYRWASEVLNKGGSYENLSSANSSKGTMPPLDRLKALSKAKYEKDRP